MKEALDFLKENNEVAFATIGNGRPQMRVFQIMKQSVVRYRTAQTSLCGTAGESRRGDPLPVWKHLRTSERRRRIRCADDICKEIYETNPVLSRLYPDYKSLAYFRVEIDRLDYYDLTPTPPILRHYDRASGQYVDLNPFGEKKA